MATKVDVNKLIETGDKLIVDHKSHIQSLFEYSSKYIEKIEMNLGSMMTHLEDEVSNEPKFSDEIKTLIFEKIENAKKEFQSNMSSK